MQPKITSVQKIQEVSALLAVPGSRIIAGGTSVSDHGTETHLIDISGLEGLNGIRQKGNRIELGPLTTLSEAEHSMLIKAAAPALAESAAMAAAPEIRERATIGGNLASEKIGDTAAAFLASGAKLTIKTESDYREILIDRFWDKNGSNDLSYDEWITRITIPVCRDRSWGASFGKLGTWDSSGDPSVSAAIQLSLDDNNIVTAVRGGIRFGSGIIRRMFPLEKALKDHPATEAFIDKAVRGMIPAAGEYLSETECCDFLKGILRRCIAMAEGRRSL